MRSLDQRPVVPVARHDGFFCAAFYRGYRSLIARSGFVGCQVQAGDWNNDRGVHWAIGGDEQDEEG